MIDTREIYSEYAKCLKDKTRIYLTEHYFQTNKAGKVVPFVLFPRQKAFLNSLANNKNTIAIKPRQAGITTTTAAWTAGQILMADKNSPETVLCIANKLEMAQDMLKKIETFLEQAPRWLWGNNEYYSPDPNDERNKKSVFITRNSKELKLFNGCRVVAKSSGENAARGVSAVSILILDEAAFIEEGQSVYASAVAATASVPHARIVMVSTPNGKDPLYYDTYVKALDKKNGYNVVEFRWYQDPRYNKHLSWTKKNEETGEIDVSVEPTIGPGGDIPYDEEKWQSMVEDGWKPTSPWYESMKDTFNHNSIKIAQELDVSFVGSSATVLDTEYIDMQRNLNVREPLTTMSDPLSPETWFWKPPIDGHRYIVAADPSAGDSSSADNTVIEIIDIDGVDDETGLPIIEQVAEYQGKRPGDEIGEMLFNYATMYNNALIVVEGIGGVGDAALIQLQRMKYKNLYYDYPSLKNYASETDLEKFKATSGTDTKQAPGFRSNALRFQMLSNFATMVKTNQYKIRSIRVIHELETWIFKNGRQDHMHGQHDDTITCSAMALFIIQYVVNRAADASKKDKAILKAYMTTSHSTPTQSSGPYGQQSISVRPNSLPIYGGARNNDNPIAQYAWVIA